MLAHVLLEVFILLEGLGAHRAGVQVLWLGLMGQQVAQVDTELPALQTTLLTTVRPVVGVDIHVFGEGTLAGEAAPTLTAHKRLLSAVLDSMTQQSHSAAIASLTLPTFVRL